MVPAVFARCCWTRLWPLVNESVANRLFEGLDELEEALAKRCVATSEHPELLRSHTFYHW